MSAQVKVARAAARGDPGILGDLFKGVAKIGTGLVKAANIPVVSGIAGNINEALSGSGNRMPPEGGGTTVEGQQVGFQTPTGAVSTPIAPARNGGFRFNVGGESGVTFQRGGNITGRGSFGPAQVEIEATPQEIKDAGMLMMSNGKMCAMKDLVPNKSDYYRRDPNSGAIVFVPKGTRLVKKRRRNPMNWKRTKNAITQVKAAKTAAKKLSDITVRKPSCKKK